jgi:hypothetical protein
MYASTSELRTLKLQENEIKLTGYGHAVTDLRKHVHAYIRVHLHTKT